MLQLNTCIDHKSIVNLDLYRDMGFGVEMMFSPFHMIINDNNFLLIYAIDESLSLFRFVAFHKGGQQV